MVFSNLNVVNFDNVKLKYIQNIPIPKIPLSADAFFEKSENEMYLIEFKNGRMKIKDGFEVRLKMFDSLLLLTDILSKGVSFTRQCLSFILVYNEGKNEISENNEEMQISNSRTEIINKTHRLAKENYIRFNLERFKTLYFKNVFTLTVDEFRQKFLTRWEKCES
jgi:hypothetical protein